MWSSSQSNFRTEVRLVPLDTSARKGREVTRSCRSRQLLSKLEEPAASAPPRPPATALGSGLARGVLVVIVVLCTTAGSANASFPGRNGRIAYDLDGSDRYARGPSSMRAVSPRTRTIQVLHDCPRRSGGPEPVCAVGGPRYSPDGSRIAFGKTFIAYPPGQAWQHQSGIGIAASNGSQFEFHPTEPTPQFPTLSWSPGGDQFLLERAVAPLTLSISSLDGSELRRLTFPGIAGARADWSSTGRIVFQGRLDSDTCPACVDLFVTSIGGTPRRLTYRGGESASWSPHAGKIAFVRRARPGGQGDIYIVRQNGRGLRRLTRRGGDGPAWSPDGKQIAFVRDGDMYVIRTDGTRKRRLVDQEPGDGVISLDWQPRPRR